MRRNLGIPFALMLFLSAASLATPWPVTAQGLSPREIAMRQMTERVKVLCMPRLAGRANGADEMLPLSGMLARWFSAARLSAVNENIWEQTFALHGDGLEGKYMRNAVGMVRGSGSLIHRWIVVGAHFDHLGRTSDAPPPPAVPGPGQYYPGANDNASGVVTMVEVAARTKLGVDEPRRNVLFIGFGGEEVGLQGSAYFLEHPLVPLDKIDLMINFDIVGRLEDGPLHVAGVGTAPRLREHLLAANTADLSLELSDGGWAGSDHVSFLAREIPALFFFTGPYPEYNRPSDDWDTLDYAGMLDIAEFAARFLEAVRTDKGEFPYQAVAGGPDFAAAAGEGNRATWFGSVPEFGAEAAGYRLAGVLPGSPAEAAGLQAGDLIVNFGGEPVADLPGFTVALRRHAPGDLVEVVVERDGRTLRFNVVLGDRADRTD